MQRPPRETITIEDILITQELDRRNSRPANLLQENQALHALTRQLVKQPETILQSLVDIAIKLCSAGTAGISLIETTPTGAEIFGWNVLAGALKRYVGGNIPRDLSLCGICLEYGTPQLYSYPERYFIYLQTAQTPIVEALVLPLIADNHALGTIWILSHDEQQHFDSEDVRIMTSLADLAGAALLLNQRQTQQLLAKNAQLEVEVAQRKRAEELARNSEAYFHAMMENLPGGAAFVVDRNLRYLIAEGDALHTAGFKSADFVGKTIFEVLPPELTTYYEPMYRQALAGEVFEHEHYAHDRTYISRGTPLRAENGEIYAVLAISYDITDRKRAEAALRESEERFRAFVMASSDMVYRMSADWREMRNLEGKKILINTEVPSQTWIETYIPTAEQSLVWAAIEAAIRTKTTFELEHRVIRQDGTLGWVFSRATPMLDEQGDIIEWFGAGSDITARKQTEAALRESEEKYRLLFTSIDEGYALCEVMYDENERLVDVQYLEVNPAFEKLSGLENVVGKTAVELNPIVESFWLEVIDQVVRTGEATRVENYAEGLNLWLDVYFSRVGGEGSRQIAIVFNNITDRKRTEAKLRRAAELDAFRVKLSDALRSLTDPVQIQAEASRLLGEHLGVDRAYYVEVNESQSYTRVNQNYLRGNSPSLVGVYRLADYGWTMPLLQRGETIIVADTQTSDIVPAADRAAMTTVRIASHITVPLIKAGTLVGSLCVTESVPRQWSEAEVELVRETAERIWASIIRAHAETELRESEIGRVREQSAREEERQRAESLAELDRAKTLFFSNVSHEFRTPLTLLLAPLSDALSDSANPLPPAQRERLELAHRNSLRLLKLVNTLLDFSRIEAGRIEAVYEPTDLAMYTTDLASVFRSTIEQAGLRLVVDCPPLAEPVYVDREMWEKIVLNLLSNAFKFTLEGEITVRLRLADDHHVKLQIEDTGTGIEPKELPHLMKRFYQVRGAKARTHEGSGIGLALVHELIKLHGGTIDVTSTPGVGSCFSVTIPLGTAHLPSIAEGDRARCIQGTTPYVQEAELWIPQEGTRDWGIGAREDTSSLQPLASSPSAHIFIVDDNADMRDYLTRILSDYVQVEAFADGEAALAAATQQVPDLVLSDVMMPLLDGFGLLKALRADARTKEIPIILLSARAGEESIIEGLLAGADDYLIKPFSANELVTRVNASLQMANRRSQTLHQERTINRRKDEVLSVVSHELNTPLVAILGWTRLLQSNSPSPAMLTKALEIIERNATLQAKLVEDLLDISRITANKISLNLEPVQLQGVIESAIATVQQSLNTKEIRCQCTLEPSPMTVQGDSQRLHQIILNLLINAVKFTPNGGRIELSLTRDENQAQLVISDTGCGIDAELMPYIFDTFRQAPGTKKGLGLGLAIARSLVQLHDGTIAAISPGIGQGATFTVKLPLI